MDSRKRKSRWGAEDTKVVLPGIPTVLPKGLTPQQTDEFLIQLRLDEIGRKLRTGDIIPPERERSPSPEPIYGADGKRTNTRDVRYRKKLEDERHQIVRDALRRIPGFRPPLDYKRPTRVQDKLWIPAKDYPEINFIGLLLGPRGNTLKKMEADSGAKISIRGKGSVKEGKARADGALAPGEEEDLHCLVTADAEEKVQACMKMIEKIIETAASVPEGQNQLKQEQLRALAILNGTLREDDQQICQNCGATGHRKFDCPDNKNYTVNLVCRICNSAGHLTKDCMERNNPTALFAASQRSQNIENEVNNFMAEIGGGSGGQTNGGGESRGGGGGGGGGSGGAPWQRGSSSGSSNPWRQDHDQNQGGGMGGMGGGMAPPPWGAPMPYMPPHMAMPPPPPPPGASGPPGVAPPGWGAPPPPPGFYPGQAAPPPMPYGGAPGYGYPPAPAWAPPPPPPVAAPPPPPPSSEPPPPPPPE
ncbi:hypothetical protein HK101_007963 [Irineochytrium annulatum]|nr:hypothetical protein HK101_007963 [Irineochytrium annulatum]